MTTHTRTHALVHLQVVANVNGRPAAMYAWLTWALNDRLRDQLVLWSLKLRKKD